MGLTHLLVRKPIDFVGRTLVRQINKPMGFAVAGATASLIGITQANRVNQTGLISPKGLLSVGVGASVGAYMIGVGTCYSKPYFSSMGKTALAATLVGAGLGAVLNKMQLIPEVHIDVRFGDKVPVPDAV